MLLFLKCLETREIGLQRMILVMHWAVKQLRKHRLQSARCISISIDDRKDFRILRYRCDLQEAGAESKATGMKSVIQYPDGCAALEDWCSIGPAAVEGILGVFRIGQDSPDNTLESHNTDKSEAMADSVEEMLKRSCQDPEGVLDNEALQHIRNAIFHFSSDQGTTAAKCGKVFAARLPNLVWLSYDPAHQVRIAHKDPLHAVPAFEEQWQRLFASRHALVPDIQNSELWRSRLLAVQRKMLEVHGSQCGVERVLKTFSFAQQRFDSTASPLFKYCCVVRAVAILCAAQATDVAWHFDYVFI